MQLVAAQDKGNQESIIYLNDQILQKEMALAALD